MTEKDSDISHDEAPENLYVYECEGERLPQSEPVHGAFLGLWMEPPYYYLFFREPAKAVVNQWLHTEPGYRFQRSYTLPYSAWRENVVRQERVGPFVIYTGSKRRETAPGTLEIHLTRGLAFGSGLHPSTRGCLLALAWLHACRPLETVLDVGTGSGILTLAARRLGARLVLGLDCNLLAVREALENVRLNDLGEGVGLLVASGLEALKPAVDVVVMNLEWPCLLAELADGRWHGCRRLVLSGFLDVQWPTLEKRLHPGWIVLHRYCLDDWMTAVLHSPIRDFRPTDVES